MSLRYDIAKVIDNPHGYTLLSLLADQDARRRGIFSDITTIVTLPFVFKPGVRDAQLEA